ncbi:N2,N2-dimethylguanosine tRNA methyltransferase [Pluteus cervinus]|uniref:N2,N2-dimethylguanosine tRNA methyltransferase n=1 Tax=Pluteus cervinus TaxID=181527 RepID=A0ACD3BDZ2_9AGAR|nr:N2,N2-dimethylguanosine tRNA methyltransferase [Pluteus cervinus]
MAATDIIVPDGFTLHTENTAHLLLASNEAFLNPVQEFNRDISIACIRTWSEAHDSVKEARWKTTQEKKARKLQKVGEKKERTEGDASVNALASTSKETEGVEEASYKPYKFTLLEALSATGLRSIRYAKEIPLLKHVIANDLSPAAVEAMKRNVDINGLGPQPSETDGGDLGKVRINEGDACTLMYSHREERKRVDVVDLDPYGTAAPFIDAAVQCVADGGLLCVTCTDLTVLATSNYPEKCFSNYGGVPVKAEYCHEAALRLVLHAISTSAARYGRYIEPLVSLSIDFYVRVFVRVRTAPLEVKKALSKTANYYVCSFCQTPYEQPLGKVIEKAHEASGNVNYLFKIQAAPSVGDHCPECNSTMHLAGPMWSGPIHDPTFIGKVLEHLEGHEGQYGTAVRIKGMLTVAKEASSSILWQELNTPFYFTPAKVASFFHCTTPSLDDVASALLHTGYKVSRSHACAGSLKTDATRRIVHDVYRNWVKKHPVKMENVGEKSQARILLGKEPGFEANFSKHPDSVTRSSQVKLVRYQENPTSHWGPGTRASGAKRKREKDDE